MRKIVIHDVIHQDALDLMAARNDVEVVSVAGDDRAGVLREIADAAGVILRYLPLDREAIEAARDLQIIARHGVGYDNVDIEAASAAGIPVATIGDANALTVAELTLYFMLAAAKQGPVHAAVVGDSSAGDVVVGSLRLYEGRRYGAGKPAVEIKDAGR